MHHHNRVWISTTILLLACALSAVAQYNTATGVDALQNDSSGDGRQLKLLINDN